MGPSSTPVGIAKYFWRRMEYLCHSWSVEDLAWRVKASRPMCAPALSRRKRRGGLQWNRERQRRSGRAIPGNMDPFMRYPPPSPQSSVKFSQGANDMRHGSTILT